jgi:hypothetical protein
MNNMKKASVLVGGLIVSVCVWCFSGLGRAAEPQAPSAKDVVSKVLTEHSFTPAIVLPGPPGLVWYVGCRSLTPLLTEQAIVGVRSGNAVTVEMRAFHREKRDGPWAPVAFGDTALAGNMKGQLEKELPAGEKPAKPEAGKAKAK